MRSDRIGLLLKSSRRQLGLTREAIAKLAGVSPRLVAELERGQRPNVSLESALRLLDIAGVAVVAGTPDGAVTEIHTKSVAVLHRLARAERRRKTWTGRHLSLREEGVDPRPVGATSKRLAAVAEVSRQAYALPSAQSRNGGAAHTKRRRS